MAIGDQFSRLTVSSEPVNGWVDVVCVCGTHKRIRWRKIATGWTKSCGCIRTENTKRLRATHGSCQTPEYKSWTAMLRRCRNKADIGFPLYGGRGITVCDRWLSFENFRADMGPKVAGHTLDRIDSEGNYEPGNCRWATQREQQNNRRNNLNLTLGETTMTVSEWARALGVKDKTLRSRLDYGWSHERVLTEPVRQLAK